MNVKVLFKVELNNRIMKRQDIGILILQQSTQIDYKIVGFKISSWRKRI